MTEKPTGTKRVFGPDQRDGKWWVYAYVDGQQKEWGPFASEAFAQGAQSALERLYRDEPVKSQMTAQLTAQKARGQGR